jgi:hypothetical protein
LLLPWQLLLNLTATAAGLVIKLQLKRTRHAAITI